MVRRTKTAGKTKDQHKWAEPAFGTRKNVEVWNTRKHQRIVRTVQQTVERNKKTITKSFQHDWLVDRTHANYHHFQYHH